MPWNNSVDCYFSHLIHACTICCCFSVVLCCLLQLCQGHLPLYINGFVKHGIHVIFWRVIHVCPISMETYDTATFSFFQMNVHFRLQRCLCFLGLKNSNNMCISGNPTLPRKGQVVSGFQDFSSNFKPKRPSFVVKSIRKKYRSYELNFVWQYVWKKRINMWLCKGMFTRVLQVN